MRFNLATSSIRSNLITLHLKDTECFMQKFNRLEIYKKINVTWVSRKHGEAKGSNLFINTTGPHNGITDAHAGTYPSRKFYAASIRIVMLTAPVITNSNLTTQQNPLPHHTSLTQIHATIHCACSPRILGIYQRVGN